MNAGDDLPDARIQALIDLGRYEDAERVARSALARCPYDVELLLMLSFVLRMQRRPQEALWAADEAAREDPDDGDVHYSRGAALLDLNRNADALGAAEEACRLDPHESGNHALCSTALRQVKRYADAREAALTAVSLSPDDLTGLVVLGEAEVELDDLTAAQAVFQEVLSRDAENIGALEGLRTVHWYRGQVRESLSVTEAIARIDPREDVAFEMTLPLDMAILLCCPVLLGAGLLCLLGAVLSLGGYAWILRGLGTVATVGMAGYTVRLLLPAGRLAWQSVRGKRPILRVLTWSCFAGEALAIASVIAAAVAGSTATALWALASIVLIWVLFAAKLLIERSDAGKRL